MNYLDEMAAVYRRLAEAGIFVLLDMHQDQWGPKYGGFGHPEWSNLDDGLPPQPNVGFPFNYWLMPALWRAFENFWENHPAADGIGLQDHYAAAWREVAARLAGDSHLLGYDLMNEPALGSLWAACTSVTAPLTRCAETDRSWLAPFHQRVADAIRSVDGESVIWYEPWGGFAFGASTFHPPLEDPAPPTGFSFHVYCLLGGAGPFALGTSDVCAQRDEQGFQNAQSQPDPKAARLLSEFGATPDKQELDRLADAADRYLVSWQHWLYARNVGGLSLGEAPDDPPPAGLTADQTAAIVLDPRRPLVGDNVDQGKLDVLGRPYPRMVSGTPLSYGFDQGTRVFELRYSTARADGHGSFGPRSLSEVFVPARHYPSGYRVTVEGARIVRGADPQSLRLRSSPGAGEVSLRIEPRAP